MTEPAARSTVADRDRKALAHFRGLFQYPKSAAFFNHAGHAPLSRIAIARGEEMNRRVSHRLEDVDVESFDMVPQIARHVAALIKAPKNRIAFMPNATSGLNTTLWGLGLQPGDEVLLPAVEFPTLVYAYRGLEHNAGVRIRYVPCPEGHMDLDALECALKRMRARVLALSWVQYFNGYRYDLKAITDLAHGHGVAVVVDGTQGVGTRPLDVRALGIDALACGAQKWLLSQNGTGFAYIAADPIRPIEPLYRGWLGADWRCDWNDLQKKGLPFIADGRAWEGGTYPAILLRYMITGLELIREAGLPRIARRIEFLLRRLETGLADTPVTINCDRTPTHRSAILTFSGPGQRELFLRLQEKRIIVALREGSIRVSPHFYNTDDEIDRLIGAIRKFYGNKRLR